MIVAPNASRSLSKRTTSRHICGLVFVAAGERPADCVDDDEDTLPQLALEFANALDDLSQIGIVVAQVDRARQRPYGHIIQLDVVTFGPGMRAERDACGALGQR